MLYIYHGTDTDSGREKVHALIDGLLTKQPDASDFRLEADDVTADRLHEYIESQGLFANRYIVFLDHPFETEESADVVTQLRKNIGASENIFIILTGPLTQTTLKKFDTHAEKIVTVGSARRSTKEKEFNIFTLTDALGARHAGKLWMLYTQARRSGKAAEEIHGVLWWQIKSMLLASKSRDATEAGLKPFVFTKSKRYAQNFNDAELTTLARTYVDIHARARRGDGDLGTLLEAQILSL